MFQISRRVDYAVRIMTELGMLEDVSKRLSVRKLSRKTGVPKAFLHKITADLVKANLVVTHAGPTGGLTLRKPVNQIDMLQILEAVEGPVALNICLIDPQACGFQRTCAAHDFWDELQTEITQKLRQTTLAHIVAEARQLKSQPKPKPATYYVPEEDIHVE